MKIWLLQNSHQVLSSFVGRIRWGFFAVFGRCSVCLRFSFKIRWGLFFPDIAPHCTCIFKQFGKMFSCLPSVLLFLLSVSINRASFIFFGVIFYCFIFLHIFPFFFVYFSGLNAFSRFNLSCLFFFSVIAFDVVLLFHSSFLVSIKSNLCCINIKFTVGFLFFLHNVRYSFCQIRKLNWMLQLKVFPYVFILHFKAINIFLIFHFHVGCV